MHVLVITPHPDDEAIGCGGTLLRHVEHGDRVSVIFLTSGEKGGHGRREEETARLREQEARQAAVLLGIDAFEFWHLPDGGVAVTEELVARVRERINSDEMQLIYVPHAGEMHADHQAAASLVGTAAKGLPTERRPEVRMYEVWTPLQEMDEIVDISSYMERKLAAVRAYASQCSVLRFDDAIAGLNRYRGEMHSWPGGDYAEVFLRMEP